MRVGRVGGVMRVGGVAAHVAVRRTIRRIVRITALDLVIINNQSCYKGNPIFLYEGHYVYEDPNDPSGYVQVEIVPSA